MILPYTAQMTLLKPSLDLPVPAPKLMALATKLAEPKLWLCVGVRPHFSAILLVRFQSMNFLYRKSHLPGHCQDQSLWIMERSRTAVLDQDLGTHTAVDTGGLAVLEIRVTLVSVAESDKMEARADVLEQVMVVGGVKLAGILGSIVVRVADERSLPVSVELVP
jgi:hypothetical protein